MGTIEEASSLYSYIYDKKEASIRQNVLLYYVPLSCYAMQDIYFINLAKMLSKREVIMLLADGDQVQKSDLIKMLCVMPYCRKSSSWLASLILSYSIVNTKEKDLVF